jgi:uncharacterized membrane protein
MKREKLKWLNRTAISLILIASFMLGSHVTPDNQLEIFKNLITIAAIIFAVMGAWLSLVKHDIATGIESAENDNISQEYVDKARTLVTPMTASAVILLLSCIYMFTYYAFNEMSFAKNGNPFLVNSITFSLSATLTYYQITSVFSALFSGAKFLIDISNLNQENRAKRMRNIK